MSPQVVKAARSVQESKCLSIEQGDTIAIIDGRSELKHFKGQNQRTYEIGVFPRHILEKTKHTNSDLIRTMYEHKKNALQTGSAFGFCWGGAGMVASSCNDFQGMEHRHRKGMSAHEFGNGIGSQPLQSHAKERRSVINKQFSYNKLINEQIINQRVHDKDNKHMKSKARGGPSRPPPPNQQHHPESLMTSGNGQMEGILIDLTPADTSLNSSGNLASSRSPSMGVGNHLKHLGESSSLSLDNTFCILDAPIDVPTEDDEYNNESPHPYLYNNLSSFSNDGLHNHEQKESILTNNSSHTPERNVLPKPTFNYDTALTPRLAPPPYQMPPTYSNSIEMSSMTGSNLRLQDTDGVSMPSDFHYTNVLQMNQQHEQMKR